MDGVFMSQAVAAIQLRALAFPRLIDAWTDFILSRQATRSTPAKIEFYQSAAIAFLNRAESKASRSPIK
jgi:hypothetical protein